MVGVDMVRQSDCFATMRSYPPYRMQDKYVRERASLFTLSSSMYLTTFCIKPKASRLPDVTHVMVAFSQT